MRRHSDGDPRPTPGGLRRALITGHFHPGGPDARAERRTDAESAHAGNVTDAPDHPRVAEGEAMTGSAAITAFVQGCDIQGRIRLASQPYAP